MWGLSFASPEQTVFDDINLFRLEDQEKQPRRVSVRPFNVSSAPRLPPAPPDIDDIFSQFSQKDISSTQAFKENCARFGSTRPKAPLQVDSQTYGSSSSWNANSDSGNTGIERGHGFTGSNYGLDVRHDNFFQTTPPQLELDEDDYLYPEDSPELFSTDKNQSSSSTGKVRPQCVRDSTQEHGTVSASEDAAPLRHDSYGDSLTTPNPLLIPAQTPSFADKRGMLALRSTSEISERYRSVFSQFPYFNIVQSRVFDEVLYTDRPIVVCAPTGSGKTVIFELAIIRLLMTAGAAMENMKIVYMAPMKALCSERFSDWTSKFGPLGLKCKEVTGDSELEDYFEIQDVNIIMTTPEKWDSMTRKWKDNKSLVQSVQLFLIDEVHLLNDEDRGATVEAVISRMKTVQSAITRSRNGPNFKAAMRLLAISATIPNVEDVAAWLGGIEHPASSYSMDDSHRPVKLRKVVLGFPMHSSMSEFKFDLSLNYKLSGIIQTYSDHKPTLVFCSTRKGTQQAANILIKEVRFIINSQHRQRLQPVANSLHDSKLRELVICGVGYHHAGLDMTDRKSIEAMFLKGELPVLFATSTLAVGVNLPAHLVIIKSTHCYAKGVYVEYSETQILQMIGRAGRPQFDTSATAVILTTTAKKERYSALLQGTHNIESSLHRHLIEHLNAEIVLHTITDVSVALEWLKSTFLFIRIQKNPTYYGIPEGLSKDALEQKLQDMCIKNLNTLERVSLIKMDDGFDLKPADPGRLMARYCIAFDSIKEFLGIEGSESLSDMVCLISKCKEFSDVKLRVNEKRALNTLNKDKQKATIRFPVNGRIKTTDQKITCLIQATLGCLTIAEFSLNQDITKIFRSGQRVTRCLMELLLLRNEFKAMLNAIIIAKCMKARLWENSKYVSKQLEKVGTTLSTMLVNAGLTTFKKIEETNPREIELIVNRHPPFGSQIREAASSLPKYEIAVEQKGSYTPLRAEIVVTLTMINYMKRQDLADSRRTNHFCVLLVGDANNKVVCKQRLGDSVFLREGVWSRRIEVRRASKSPELSINLISQDYVGIDISNTYTPYYSGSYFPSVQGAPSNPRVSTKGFKSTATPKITGKPCNHRCLNKDICGHECCKLGVGVGVKSRDALQKKRNEIKEPVATAPSPNARKGERDASKMNTFLHQLHQRAYSIPGTPAAKRLKVPISSAPIRESSVETLSTNLHTNFAYTRTPRVQLDSGDHSQAKAMTGASRKKGEWDEIAFHQQKQTQLWETGENEDFFLDDFNDDDLDVLPSLYDYGMSACAPKEAQNKYEPTMYGAANREPLAKQSRVSPYFMDRDKSCNETRDQWSHTDRKDIYSQREGDLGPSCQIGNVRVRNPTRGSNKRTAATSMFQQFKQQRVPHLSPPPPTPGWHDFEMSEEHPPESSTFPKAVPYRSELSRAAPEIEPEILFQSEDSRSSAVPPFFSSRAIPGVEQAQDQDDHDAFSGIFHGVF